MAIIQHCQIDPFVEAKILNAAASNAADNYSDIAECRGKTAGYIELKTAGFAAGTDLIATITLKGGVTADTSLMQPVTIDGTECLPDTTTGWPTGLTLSSNVITFAATFESNTTIQIPIINLPPYVCAYTNYTSGGSTSATISLTVIAA